MSTDIIPQRTCTKCHQSFPATLEHFHKQKNGKYGLSSWCIECHRAVNKKNTHIWHQENKEYSAEYSKQYHIDNKEMRNAACRDYYWSDPERERARIKENKSRFRVRINQGRRANYHRRKDVIRPIVNARRAHKMATDPDYRARVKIQAKQGKAKRRALIANAEGTHTAADIRLQIAAQTDKKNRLRCWWCGAIIKDGYHLDHRTALAKGGSNGADNLVISCPTCNTSKGAKSPQEFAGRLI